jgi:hypothetical protein
MARQTDIKRFFEAITSGNDGGLISIFSLPGQKSYFHKEDDLGGIVKRCMTLREKQNVYYGTGLLAKRPAPGKRGTESDIIGIPGFFFDVDHSGGIHAEKENLPTQQQALDLIHSYPFKPTMIVDTTGGYHPYWLFKETYYFESNGDRQEAKTALNNFQNWFLQQIPALDKTAALNHLLRVPGTYNRKGKPKLVKILEYNNFRYNVEELEPYFIESSTEKLPQEHTVEHSAAIEKLKRCNFLKHCIDDASALSEITWHAMVCALCFEKRAPKLIHKLSEPYPCYNPKETDQKILNALSNQDGPMTCAAIRQRTGFSECPSKGCGVKCPVHITVSPTKIEVIGYTANELMKMDLPEPKWAVPGILVQGYTVLGGKPKHGKSMMSLNFSIAVSNGNKALGNIEILENGAVIYLALEDTARRLQSRLKQMYAHNEKAAPNLHLFTSWPRMDQNGLELLEEKIKSIPDTRLVIIDTVAKIRPPRPKNTSPYDYDYEVGSKLKAVADRTSVNLLGIAHLRKTESEDRMDDVSGTFGITGAADSILVLLRRTGQANAELRLTGRDVESAEYGLKFDARTLSWNLIGKMDEIKKTAHQQKLYNAIKKYGHPATPKELVEMTGLKYKFIANTLPKLIKQGKVTKAGYGKYIHFDNITGESGESEDSGITEESGDS